MGDTKQKEVDAGLGKLMAKVLSPPGGPSFLFGVSFIKTQFVGNASVLELLFPNKAQGWSSPGKSRILVAKARTRGTLPRPSGSQPAPMEHPLSHPRSESTFHAAGLMLELRALHFPWRWVLCPLGVFPIWSLAFPQAWLPVQSLPPALVSVTQPKFHLLPGSPLLLCPSDFPPCVSTEPRLAGLLTSVLVILVSTV